MRTLIAAMGLTLFVAGCSFHARAPDDYSKVTRELLATRKGDVQKCYTKKATKDESLAGSVVVKFEVEAKTGKVINVIASKHSTAPEALQKCVLKTMDGLVLDPPDLRTGQAKFTYEFEVKEP